MTVWLSLVLLPLSAQEKTDTVYTFRFMPDRDMFYIPYSGNDTELARLEECIRNHKTDILDGKLPLYVDGYCNSFDSEAENLSTAKIRSNSNRVKSELITRQQLTEECFITKNHSGSGDYVTVRIVIPADKDEEARLAAERAEQERIAAEQAERQRLAAERAEAERIAREKEQARLAAEQAKADSLAAAQRITDAPVTEPAAVKPAASWYAGIQAGMPFGTSAMSSFGADRTTPGWSAGVYGGYRFNPVLSLELQAAWGQLAMNRRDCCPDYCRGRHGRLVYVRPPEPHFRAALCRAVERERARALCWNTGQPLEPRPLAAHRSHRHGVRFPPHGR